MLWLIQQAAPEYRTHPLLATRPHVAAWRKHLEAAPSPRTGRPLSPASVARKFSAVSELYRYAIELGVLDDSPVDNVKRPKVPDESQTVGLTAEELQRIFDAAEAHSPRLTALVYALLFTGSRVSEILGADVRDYRHDHGHRRCASRRKGGKVASAVLPPPAVRALDVLISERTSGPIFLNRDGTALWSGGLDASVAENDTGRIAPGMLADLTLINRDLRQIPPEEIRDAQVVRTIVGGQTVYER